MDTAIQVVPFLASEQRNEFAYLADQAVTSSAEDIEANNTPAIGDTVNQLYLKLRRLKSDEDVMAFRSKLDQPIRQALQEAIEVEQAKTASVLASLEYADAEEAQQAWEIFGRQFPKAVETGKFMTTPTKEADVKYRWRRLKETLQIDSATALEMMQKDSSPLFVDPDFIRRAWTAMCQGLAGGREEALNDLVLKHPGSLIADASIIKSQLGQAKFTATMVEITRGPFAWLREQVFDNGRKVPIGRRDEVPFGGGFPAWKRQWEAEMKRRDEEAKR